MPIRWYSSAPLKFLKPLGKDGNENGHNYHLMIGSSTMKSWSKVDDVFSLTNMPDEKQSFNVNKNKSVNSREQGLDSVIYAISALA
jgi:hypothetical protein